MGLIRAKPKSNVVCMFGNKAKVEKPVSGLQATS